MSSSHARTSSSGSSTPYSNSSSYGGNSSVPGPPTTLVPRYGGMGVGDWGRDGGRTRSSSTGGVPMGSVWSQNWSTLCTNY